MVCSSFEWCGKALLMCKDCGRASRKDIQESDGQKYAYSSGSRQFNVATTMGTEKFNNRGWRTNWAQWDFVWFPSQSTILGSLLSRIGSDGQ